MGALLAVVFLAGLVAALAPTAMVALLTILTTPRGIRGGLWFAAGYAAVAIVLLTLALTVLHGVSYGSTRQHELIGGGAELTLGLILTAGSVGWWLGRRSRRRRSAVDGDAPVAGDSSADKPATAGAGSSADSVRAADIAAATASDGPDSAGDPHETRAPGARGFLSRWVARLDSMPAYGAFGVGAFLSSARVRNLLATLVVANAVTAPSVAVAEAVVGCAVFLIVALAPVWTPLLLFAVGRRRGSDLAAGMQRWVTAHGASLGTLLVGLFGALLVAHGLSQMLGIDW